MKEDQPIRRAAMYLRVSTLKQETDTQLLQAARFIEAHGWERVDLVDHGSGKDSNRLKFQELFSLAARREIDVVVVWAIDRFTREGVAETFSHIKRLHDYGVAFVSVTEPYFSTMGPAGELLIAIAAWIAKQERIRKVERVRAGIERVRVKLPDGRVEWKTKSGRPPGREPRVFDREAVRLERAAGASWAQLAERHGIGQTTARRACAA